MTNYPASLQLRTTLHKWDPAIGIPRSGSNIMSLSKRLWEECKEIADSVLNHPFIVGLADGTLDHKAFRHFIEQDTLYLPVYAQVCGKAGDDSDLQHVKSFLKNVQRGASEERKNLAQDWGVDLSKEILAAYATEEYCRFLLDTSAGKIEDSGTETVETRVLVAFTLGAIAPCVVLYAFLGAQINVEEGHPFYKWVSKYGSPYFQACASKLELVLDSLGPTLTKREHDIIGKLYKRAMTLELAFFGGHTN